MSNTASSNYSKSPLLQKMRGAFQQQSQFVVSKQANQQQVQPAQELSQAPVQPTAVLNTQQKLEILDSVLTSVEEQTPASSSQVDASVAATASVPQVVPQQPIQVRQQNVGMVAQATPVAVDQVVQHQQQLQAAQAGGTAGKEALAAGTAASAVETGTAIQYVEQEQSPELSPEVAGYLQHVEDHTAQEPQELVVGEAQQQQPLPTNYQKQSVVVLPITPTMEKKGSRKGPLESIRWLVEWSRKLMKMFSGSIIYREVEN
jgi:hypothetical protein